jgi:hypothetical protein
VKYWTVLDDELGVVGPADAFLRYTRLGRDGSCVGGRPLTMKPGANVYRGM